MIRDGLIERLGADLSAQAADHVIDARGLTVLLGMIDSQVRFREPGMSNKADIASESRAAVAGGITSYLDMPNTIPNTLNRALLEDKYTLAATRSRANHGFYFGAANDNLEEIKRLDPRAACGVKVFMGASTGNMLVDDLSVLEGIFRHAPTLIATHCEDTPTIRANEERYRASYGENVPIELHPLIRSRKACVHFLHFTEADYATKGTLIKCNPAIKTAADRVGLIDALLADRLDIIATDHAPHPWEEKQRGYFGAPSGLPLVQYALLSLLEHYHDGRFTLPFIARKTAHAVADCFQIKERGYIREGYWADLVLLDLERGTTASNADVLSKCGWTPFDGYRFRSRVHATIVSGQVAWENGVIQPSVRGRRLAYNR